MEDVIEERNMKKETGKGNEGGREEGTEKERKRDKEGSLKMVGNARVIILRSKEPESKKKMAR